MFSLSPLAKCGTMCLRAAKLLCIATHITCLAELRHSLKSAHQQLLPQDSRLGLSLDDSARANHAPGATARIRVIDMLQPSPHRGGGTPLASALAVDVWIGRVPVVGARYGVATAYAAYAASASAVRRGLRRTIALRHRPATLYQIREQVRWLRF